MEVKAIQLKVKQRNENTTPYQTDADVTPEERHANKNQENNKQTESHMQEQLNIDAQDETVNVMKESILQRYEINQRPPIPKIKNAQSVKTAIETANKAIDQIKEESGELFLTDVNHLMYAAASAVTESLGLKKKKKRGSENPINQHGKRKLNVKYAKSGVTYLR